jgi:hypothetical protein
MKQRCLRILGILIVVFGLSGCGTPVTKSVMTASGKPEVVITTTEVGQIKAMIIGDLVNHGYSVEQDTEYSLTLARPTKGMEDVAASIGTGNAYSTNRRVANYTFIKQGDSVRVIGSSSLRAQMPGGQVRSNSLDDNANIFNTFQQQLQEIKTKIEKK